MAASPSSTFYKRPLPPPAVEFSSAQGQDVFREALLKGQLQGFFRLIEQFSTQDEPAFCGLSSLSMVLNSLSIDPGRTWKGAWRWYHDTMLDCCRPLEVVKKQGITIQEAACLASCNGAHVTVLQPPDLTVEQLRALVRAATSQQPLPPELRGCASDGQPFHLIASYSRKTFGQTGDGHFSPIGGYNDARDMVLILDVARFKYPPHWVPLPLLLDAMKPCDPSTGRPRGLLVVSARPAAPPPRAFTIDLSQDMLERTRALSVLVGEGSSQASSTSSTQCGSSVGEAAQQLLEAAPLATWEALVALRQLRSTGSPNPCGEEPATSCGSGSSTNGGIGSVSSGGLGAAVPAATSAVVAGCGCIAPVTAMGQAQVDQVLRVAHESPLVQQVVAVLSGASSPTPPTFEATVKMLALSLVHILLTNNKADEDDGNCRPTAGSAQLGGAGDGEVWVQQAAQQLQLSPLLAVEIGGLAAQALSAMQMQRSS